MQVQPGRSLKPSIVAAGVLSLLLPGLGHPYIGRPRRAIGLMIALFAWNVLLTFCRFGWLPRFWMLTTILLVGFCLYIFALVDAAVKAGRADAAVPRRFDRWYVYAGFVVAALIVYAGLNAAVGTVASGPGYYSVPSANMEPTIRVGETLLVSTLYYRTHAPARQDVVAYDYPTQPEVVHIARIVAVAGDRIEVSGGHAIVNGKAVGEPYVNLGDPAFSLNNMPSTTVAAGFVFVMGDNRSNSADSRLNGPVPVGNLIGRATEIVSSCESSRIGKWIGTPRT